MLILSVLILLSCRYWSGSAEVCVWVVWWFDKNLKWLFCLI